METSADDKYTSAGSIHVHLTMLRLRDYHGMFQGAKSNKNSNRGSHFRKQKQIISNDHTYFKTLPSEPAIHFWLLLLLTNNTSENNFRNINREYTRHC